MVPAFRRLPTAQDVVGDYAQRLFYVYLLDDYRQLVNDPIRGKTFVAAGGNRQTTYKTTRIRCGGCSNNNMLSGNQEIAHRAGRSQRLRPTIVLDLFLGRLRQLGVGVLCFLTTGFTGG